MDILFENLMKSDKKTAVLWILPGHVEKFRSKSLDSICKSLKSLYLDSCLNMPFKDLQNKCNKMFDSVSLSQEQALNMNKQKIKVRAKNGKNLRLAE